LTWLFSALYLEWELTMQAVLAIFIIGSAVFLFFVNQDQQLPPISAGRGYANISHPTATSIPSSMGQGDDGNDGNGVFAIDSSDVASPTDNDHDDDTKHQAAPVSKSSSVRSPRRVGPAATTSIAGSPLVNGVATSREDRELALELELAEVNLDQRHAIAAHE
jgi:hypothetical protein